jgi:hypothetical protein
LVHLIGFGLVVGQRRAIGGGERSRLDLMPQPQRVLAADPHLAGDLRGGNPLRDAAEDQENLGWSEMRPLPVCSCEHIKNASAPFAAVVDDRRVGATAVDVESVASRATRTGEPVGVEQVEQLPAAPFLVHQVENREVHEAAPQEES